MEEYLFEKIDKYETHEATELYDFIYRMIPEAKKNFRKVSGKELARGSKVHSLIESYLRTGIEPNIEDENVLAAFLAFLEFKDEYGVEPIEIEKTLYG